MFEYVGWIVSEALQKEGLQHLLEKNDEVSIDEELSKEQELQEEIHEEGYQTLEDKKESPHDSIKDDEDLNYERKIDKGIGEENHQEHEVEHKPWICWKGRLWF